MVVKAGRTHLIAEFVVLFIALPAAGWAVRRFGGVSLPVIPALWVLTGICLAILWRSGVFDWRALVSWSGLRAAWPGIVGRFLVAAAVLTAATALWDAHRFGQFVRNRPWVWAMVMVLYPLLSAFPQTIVYRAFLLHRYRPLVGDGWRAVALSAGAFGFCHVVLDNFLAVALTLAGGVVFARTYLRARSVPVSAAEHALYGDFLFTVGLGAHFYHGTTELLRATIGG